jgi:hypothetical protein
VRPIFVPPTSPSIRTPLTSGSQIIINGTGGGLTITGLGADRLTIDGGPGVNRIFQTTNAAAVSISGVTMQGGNGESSGTGGAILAGGASLSLSGVYLRNNTVGDRGGSLYLNGGTNRIINSAISGSSAVSVGGGIYLNGGTLAMSNTTISGNSSGTAGAIGVFGALTVRNSTMTLNSATNGGAMEVFGGSLNFGNTIIAGNSATNSFPEILNFGGITSVGNNLVGDSAGDSTNTNVAITYQASDIRDTNPRLDPLQNNGGATPTHALLNTPIVSPAIDAGSNANAVDPSTNTPLGTDQRIVFARIAGAAVDIGAFEFGAASTTAASISIGGRVTNMVGGLRGARVTFYDSNGNSVTAIANSFGYYRVDGLKAGSNYVVTASSKGYTFSSRVLTANENLTDFDFSAGN